MQTPNYECAIAIKPTFIVSPYLSQGHVSESLQSFLGNLCVQGFIGGLWNIAKRKGLESLGWNPLIYFRWCSKCFVVFTHLIFINNLMKKITITTPLYSWENRYRVNENFQDDATRNLTSEYKLVNILQCCLIQCWVLQHWMKPSFSLTDIIKDRE